MLTGYGPQMLRVVVGLGLAIQISCCPLICRGVASTARANEYRESTDTGTCSHCSDDERGHADHGVPRSSFPGDGCPCQVAGFSCICSGAILDLPDVNGVLSLYPLEWGYNAVDGRVDKCPVTGLKLTPVHHFPPDCDGRGMRALLCSLLC